MFTGKIEYVRNIYKVDRVLKSYIIFGLDKTLVSNRSKLSDFIRIEPFRGKSNSTGAQLILRGRERTKWAKKSITGLRPTLRDSVFYGDCFHNGKKSLILFQLADNNQVLVIDYFNSFYPNNPSILKDIIRNHKFLY